MPQDSCPLPCPHPRCAPIVLRSTLFRRPCLSYLIVYQKVYWFVQIVLHESIGGALKVPFYQATTSHRLDYGIFSTATLISTSMLIVFWELPSCSIYLIPLIYATPKKLDFYIDLRCKEKFSHISLGSIISTVIEISSCICKKLLSVEFFV